MAESAVSPTSRTEDAITLTLSALLIGGLFLDGYAHAYVIDTEVEDFFTPWHGVFYAAFSALAAWIAIIGYRRRMPGRLVDWFPPSHRLTIVGLGLFALGGFGDGVWHTVFGVEVGIDALLSPTHIVLLLGGLLILWTPVRSSAERDDVSAWLGLGAVTLVTATLVFFIQYLWHIPWTFFGQVPLDPVTGEGSFAVQQFLGGATAMIGVLLGPLLLIARRWPLPFGAATICWTAASALEVVAFSRQPLSILLVALGGLSFDAAYRATSRSSWQHHIASAAGPAVMFASYLIWVAADGDMGWPPEIWGGLVCYAALVGLGLAMLQQPSQPVLALDTE